MNYITKDIKIYTESLNSGFKSLLPVWTNSLNHLNCWLSENLLDTDLCLPGEYAMCCHTCKVDFYNKGKLQGHSINIKSREISQSLPWEIHGMTISRTCNTAELYPWIQVSWVQVIHKYCTEIAERLIYPICSNIYFFKVFIEFF